MSHSRTEKRRVKEAFKAATTVATQDPLVLTRIGLVGAIIEPCEDDPNVGIVSEQDQTYSNDTMMVLNEYNFPTVPQPQIAIVNRQYNDADYLLPPEVTQVPPNRQFGVGVICHLHNPMRPAIFRKTQKNKGKAWISPLHEQPGVWARSSDVRGVRLLSVFGYDPKIDVMPAMFNHAPYFGLVRYPGQEGYKTSGALLIHANYAQALLDQGRMDKRLVPFAKGHLKEFKRQGWQPKPLTAEP